MQAYDLIMLIVLAATTIFGAIKGFAWQLASLASIVVSYFVANFFRNDVAKMINAQPPWNLFLAMLLLYFGSSFIIWMVFRLVSTSIDKVKLKDFDRQLGAGFGLIKGMALCLLITMFAMTLLGSAQQQRIANSRSGLYISRILANSGGLLPAEVKQIVGPYIYDVEQRLQQNQNGLTPPAGEGFMDGLGQMAQEQFKQFGNSISNGQMTNGNAPSGFLSGGQGGALGNPGVGFQGAGQGGAGQFNSQPNANRGPSGNWQPQPGGFPISQPQPVQPNGNWPNSNVQPGFRGNEFLPR